MAHTKFVTGVGEGEQGPPPYVRALRPPPLRKRTVLIHEGDFFGPKKSTGPIAHTEAPKRTVDPANRKYSMLRIDYDLQDIL